MGKTKGGFYAVARGHIVGVFTTWLVWLWELCKAQVNGFPNARYKKFGSQKEADDFIAENKAPGSGFGGITKKKIPGVIGNPRKPSSSTTVTAPTSGPASVFKALTPGAPAWKQNFKHGIHNQVPTRGITTSLADYRKKLKVTEDRVVFNQTLSQEDGNLSFNSDADLNNFTVDEDGFVVVFTDGACQGNGKYGAKAGIGIWFGDGHELNISEPVKGRQTNNTAEIQAAEVAISQAKKAGINKLCVKTDSQFVINCITKWVDKWRKNGWKLSDGQAVKNKEDLEKLLAVMKGVQIKWSYVAGHKGNYGNDQADRLAVEGAKKRVTKN